MAIARFPTIVLDCADPDALASFYGAMLDWKTDRKADDSGSWAEIRAENGNCICFQPVADYTPPQWPGQQVPQQMHIDLIVDDLDAAEAAVLRACGTRIEIVSLGPGHSTTALVHKMARP